MFMADISDVTAFLANSATAAVYPNGTSQPSVANMDVLVHEGWPIAEQLTLDLRGLEILFKGAKPTPRPTGLRAHVSIFPVNGGSTPYQLLFPTRAQVIQAPTIDCTVSVAGNAITYTGTPALGEILTIVADRMAFSTNAAAGATNISILQALLAKVQVSFPSASLSGDVLTVPFQFEMTVRQGGVGLLGRVTHRECQRILITVWAPDPTTRSTLAKAIDVALKKRVRITLPDTSQALITYTGTNIFDDRQNEGLYRRDLIYEAEFATLETTPGTTITTVGITIQGNAASPLPPATFTTNV
jgi:hypothetical protein